MFGIIRNSYGIGGNGLSGLRGKIVKTFKQISTAKQFAKNLSSCEPVGYHVVRLSDWKFMQAYPGKVI